jgi:hypothetical protein
MNGMCRARPLNRVTHASNRQISRYVLVHLSSLRGNLSPPINFVTGGR